MTADDPSAITALAVHADDVVAALEASKQGTETVLRVTPPFSGRMRARLHRVGPDERSDGRVDGTGAVHLRPARLVDDEAPSYPRAVDTEPDGEYDVEVHHERHLAAVERWRETVVDHLVDAVDLPLPDDSENVRVAVAVLG